MLGRSSYESEDSLTSITIRQNFRLKRRSEQTQNSFRQIRHKLYEDERRDKQQKQKRPNIKMLSPIKNEVMVDEGVYNLNKLPGEHQNYHQNLCLNINIGNFNLHKNSALQNNIYCNQIPVDNQNLVNVVQKNVNQGVNQRFNDMTHNLEINRPYAQASQIPILKPSISPNFTNSPKAFQKSSQQPAVQRRIMLKYKHYLVYSNIIGSGTYSKVYLGTDLQKKVDVAVKELSQLQDNQIKVLMSVDSPYIIKLQAHWKSKNNNMTYLVLDLCQRNLREEIKLGISMDEKMRYFEQVIYGMNALFSKNIIHRDLKFENILVTKEKVAKIADFGLAKDLGMMSNVASLRCGTPYTMAPQIFFHNGYSRPYYNQKCDIWSLAVILHEMLYNKHPFNYKSERMMKMERVYIEKKYGYLDQLIDKALVKDPKYRIGWDEFLKIYQNKNIKMTNQLQMKRFQNTSKPKSINKIKNNSIKQKRQKSSEEGDRKKIQIKQVKKVQKNQERKIQIKLKQGQLQNNRRQHLLKREEDVIFYQSKYNNVNQKCQQASEMNIIAARNPSFQPIFPRMATKMQLPVQQAPKLELKFINRPTQQKDNKPSAHPKLQRSKKGNEIPQMPVDFFKNSKYNKIVQHHPQQQKKQELEINMNMNMNKIETKGNISVLLIMFCVVFAMLATFVVEKI